MPTAYTAPDAVPAGGTVTIMATAVADARRFASANVTVDTGTVVSVTFTSPPPPPTLTNGTSAMLAVSVADDPLSAGADWSVACPSAGACGSFSLTHTSSGSATFYTAPMASPAGGVVTLTAASTTDPSKKVSAVIGVSSLAPAAFLCANCNYTFVLSGTNVNGPYGFAGVFQTDGEGHITAGEQDFVEPGGNASGDRITGGSYSFGPDGRGTITLMTNDGRVGVHGVETLGVVLVSSHHALLTEFDSFGSASGTMDLQTASSFSLSTLSGAYAFVLSGQDFNSRCGAPFCLPNQPFAIGGVMNVSSPGVISQAGSVVDSNDSGVINTGQTHGSYGMPDALGRVDIKLSLSFYASTLEIAGYITDSTHLKLVEIDNNLGNTAGVAIGQGAASGTLTQPQAFSGPFVMTAIGANPLGSSLTSPFAFAAQFTAASGGIQNGSSAVNNAGNPSSGVVSGGYSVDPGGTGRVALTLAGNTSVLSNYILYLSGGSDPALVLGVDPRGVVAGFAYAQAVGPFSTSSFQGSYALNFTSLDPSSPAEDDVTGQAFADGAGNLSATLDINANRSVLSGVESAGNFNSNGAGGFSGSMASIPTGTREFTYYVVSASQVVFIEADSAGVALGLFQLQVPPF